MKEQHQYQTKHGPFLPSAPLGSHSPGPAQRDFTVLHGLFLVPEGKHPNSWHHLHSTRQILLFRSTEQVKIMVSESAVLTKSNPVSQVFVGALILKCFPSVAASPNHPAAQGSLSQTKKERGIAAPCAWEWALTFPGEFWCWWKPLIPSPPC